MADKWFRFYNDVVNDPKVQRLEPELFKALVNLWCLASKGDGILPPIEDIGFGLRIPTEVAMEIVDKLTGLGFFDVADENLRPHNWTGRQYDNRYSNRIVGEAGDYTAAERNRESRERKRNASVSRGVSTTVTFTDQEQNRTDINNIISEVNPNGDEVEASKEPTITNALLSSLFEGFWELYPRKVGKGAARIAYRNALKKTSDKQIMDGVRRYAASKPDPKFTKHPSTWLNQECWLDEPDKPKTALILSGPWKPVEKLKEKDIKPISEEERMANLAKLSKIIRPKQFPSNDVQPPCDVEQSP